MPIHSVLYEIARADHLLPDPGDGETHDGDDGRNHNEPSGFFA